MAEKKKLSNDTPVTIRSVVPSVLYASQPGRGMLYFKLEGIGDELDITYGGLLEIRNGARKMLTNPWIVVDDPDVRANMPELDDAYKRVSKIDDLSWLTKGNEKTALKNIREMPKALADIFVQRVTALYLEGKITNYNVLRAIENKYQQNFDSIKQDSVKSKSKGSAEE